MENASRALLMAASVLIGILILSLAVYLFVTFGASSAEIHKKVEEDKLNEFNTQFTVYDGREVNIYDIITVANIASDNNIYYELPKKSSETNDYYISVSLDDGSDGPLKNLLTRKTFIEKGYGTNSGIDYNEIISESLTGELKKYKCTVHISTTTNRVYHVEFK